MKTILAAIVKNEAQYIKEWVLYHKLICGFNDIFIYDNDSSDNTQTELQNLSEIGLCDWIRWPTKYHNPPQQTAYAHALNLFKDKYDWICYLDLDEFLVLKSYQNINDFVSRFDSRIGAICFNWKLFYSLEENNSKQPVIERVKYSTEAGHVKTIARTNAIKATSIHAPIIFAEYEYAHCSGKQYNIDYNERLNNLDQKICLQPKFSIVDYNDAQINHYQIKSKKEVLERDIKGRATTQSYTKKNSISSYIKLLEKQDHLTDNSISIIIENKYGNEKFNKLIDSTSKSCAKTIREIIAYQYVSGEGIEIGALHNPLLVPKNTKVHYLDRLSVLELRKQYPELANNNLVEAQIIDDGEKLLTLKDDSLDFVIANHFIEHCQNPIGTIKNMLRVLKNNGIIFMAVPNKHKTFDKDRPLTSLEHLINDYKYDPESSRLDHYKEYVSLVEKKHGEEFTRRLQYLLDINYSIHFHTWELNSFIDLLNYCQQNLNLFFTIEYYIENNNEFIFILKKRK